MANYGVNYRLNFCDSRFGKACRIDLLSKDYVGAIIPYEAGNEPLEISFKNDGDDKFNQITGSEATISILSSDTFSLQNFYTSDEQQFLCKYYIDNVLFWSGFILPDSANEPFLFNRYESTLQAKDVLGTLKTVPFVTDLGTLIKKTDSFKNILAICLAKTGLALDFWTGVNTYEKTMASGLADDPLALTFVDTNRYIDTNGNPYSCYDVLLDICNEFSANIKQSNGAWWLVDITQLAGASYNARHYNTAGIYIERATIANNKRAGLGQQLELVDHDHNISNILGYKSVTTYYQYGYLSNKILNGDFDLLNADGSTSPFQNWNNIGSINVTKGQIFNKVGNATGDYYAIIDSSNVRASYRTDPFSVKMTNIISISMDLGTPAPVTEDMRLSSTFEILLDSPGQESKWWNGTAWTNTGGTRFAFLTDWAAGENGKSINFSIASPPYDGTVTFGLGGGHFIISTVAQPNTPIYYNNVSFQASEDQYYKSPIGNVVTLTQDGYYSAIPDVTTLLFGDDVNKDRTSWMRLAGNVPTKTWYRFGKVEALKLQEIAAKNILNQHQKTSRLFEGTLMGAFNPMDTINIDLINSKFFFLAGTYYAKAAKCTVKLAELFTADLPAAQITTTTFEDFGEFKDKDGNTVGSPTGVSVGGGSVSSVDLAPYDTAAIAATKYQPLENQRLSKANTVFFNELSGNTVKIPDVTVNKFWKIYVDSSGVGGGATAPPTGGNGAVYYSQLLDVALTTLYAGQSPVWNGSKWVNQTVVTDLSNYYTKSQNDARFLPILGTAYNSTLWNGATLDTTATYDIAPSGAKYLGVNSVGNIFSYSSASMKTFLGLGTGAYNDKTKLWSVSHPNDYYISNTWDGSYWQLTSNHGSLVNVGRANNWGQAGTYLGNETVVNQLMMVYGPDGNWHPSGLANIRTFLGLGSAAYRNIGSTLTSGLDYMYGRAGTNDINPVTKEAVSAFLGLGSSAYINASVSPVANTIVQRDGSGYIKASYINYSATVESVSGVNKVYGGYSTDGYIRPLDAISIRRFLAMPDNGDTLQSVSDRGNITSQYLRSTNYVLGDQFVTGGRLYAGFDSGAAGSVSASAWFRSSGATGWYSETYGGGINMIDTTWVRVYSGKGFLVENTVQATDFLSKGIGFKSLNYHGMMGDYSENGSTDKIIWTIGSGWNELNTMYGLRYSLNSVFRSGYHQIVIGQAGGQGISLSMDGTGIFAGALYSQSLVQSPVIKATSELHIPGTSGRLWKIYVQDN